MWLRHGGYGVVVVKCVCGQEVGGHGYKVGGCDHEIS